MTPTRETIERTIARYLRLPEEADDCTDEVLRALDEAGLVVVPKEMPDAVAWAICPVAQDEAGFVCKQCPATFEYNGKRCVMGCRRSYADIYRAMIAAAPSTAPDVVG